MALSLKKAAAYYNKQKKTQKKIQKQERQEQKIRQQEAVQTNRQIQKQVGKSKVGRALMGAVYGFNTNLTPLSYSKKAEKLGYKAYTPSAAAKERGDTSKRTAEWNKALESSGSYRTGQTVGNVAATALQFALGGGLTKALAGKALKTGAVKSAQKAVTSKVANAALKEGAKRTLAQRAARAILKRSVQNSGRAVTKNAMKSAANKLVGRVVENAAQDMAGDVTVGLYKDIASARANGVNLKDPKQAAAYLGKQALFNTAIGAVTNGAVPTLGALKRNKRMWKTVEKLTKGADGKTRVRYEKVLRNTPKGKSVLDRLGNDIDIVSLRRANKGKAYQITRSAKNEAGETVSKTIRPRNLKNATITDAINDDWYVSEIRRKGINGKPVKQVAEEQNRSIADVIADDYRKRYSRSLNTARKLRNAGKKQATEDLTATLTNSSVGNRAINRGRLRSAYETASPNSGRYAVRNESGRRVVHRATGEDLINANNMRINEQRNILASRRARLAGQTADNVSESAETASKSGGFANHITPEYDIDDVRLARQLTTKKAEKWLKKNYGMDSFEYARKNNIEPSDALTMAKNEIAKNRGARKLTAQEQAEWFSKHNDLDEQLNRQAKTINQTAQEQADANTVENVMRQSNPSAQDVTAASEATSRMGKRLNGEQPLDQQPINNDVVTPSGTRVEINGVDGKTGRQAASDSSKYAWDKVDRFGDRKVSPEMRELDEYLHRHPAYQRYNKIDELRREEQALIDAKKSISDTTGNDRLDAIENELTELGAYEPYFENNRYETGRSIAEIFNLKRTTNNQKRIAELEKQLEPEVDRSKQIAAAGSTAKRIDQSVKDITTPNGTPIDVTDVNGRTGRQAAEAEAFTPDTNGAPDISMNGTRTGEATHRSRAADSVAYMEGNTAKESKETNDFLRELGANKTWSESNETAIKNATEIVDRETVDGSRSALRQMYDKNVSFDNESFAQGYITMQRYRDMERAALDQGDEAAAKAYAKSRDEVAAIISIKASETGKALQSMRIFKKMSPQGRVNAVLMTKAKISKATGVKDLTVDNDLLDMLRDAKTTADMQRIQSEISRQVWDQIPSTVTEKLAGWRYLSMLGNPRTHIRNVAGNAIFTLPRAVKNMIGSGMEKVLVPDGQRSKAFLNPLSQNDKLLVNRAIQDWDKVSDTFLNGTSRYELGLMRAEGSKIFKTVPMQKLSDFNSWALNAEDEVFAKYAYTHAYAQYLKANKISVKNATEEALEKARRYAWDEALTATYRESNALADMINKVRKGANINLRDIKNATGSERNKLIGEKAAGIAADALVPFAKTPANILKSSLNYSPVGLVRGFGKYLSAKTVADKVAAIDALAQGLSGTGILALGWLAAEHGFATASIESGYDTPEQMLGTYDKDRQKQEYSITLGGENGITIPKMELFDMLNIDVDSANKKYLGKERSVTMDWAVPAALPFFQGVELFNGTSGKSGGNESVESRLLSSAKVMSNMVKMADPVMNMSMLSSIENAFNTWSSSESGLSGLGTFIQNTTQSRLGQYVPTALGQIAKSLTPDFRSASPYNSGNLGNWESFARQQINKIPGLSQKVNPAKLDAFGQHLDKKNGVSDYIKAYIKNAGLPMNVKDVRNTAADKELQRLVNAGQAADDILPRKQTRSYITKGFKDQKFDISMEDVTKYNETYGQTSLKRINKLIGTKAYKNADDAEKASMISDIYDAAKLKAKKELAMSKGVSERDYLLSTLTDSYKDSYLERERNIKKLGVSNDTYSKIYQKVGKTERTGVNGRTTAAYVAKTLAATEVKDGVKNFKQAEAATNARDYTWKRVVRLSQAGYTAKQCIKFALSDKEREPLKYYSRNGKPSGELDMKKLADYINKMDISKREKWARFEVNKIKDYDNPF